MLSMASYAAECWVDIYDKPNCEGAHVRISGPAKLRSLRALNESDWSNRIESVRVGPDARFVGYIREDFDASHAPPSAHPDAFKSWGESQLPSYLNLEIDIGAGRTESHLADLGFHRKIQSIKLECSR